MRNWNFPTFSLYPAPFFSFEPTYEELKPARAFYITPVFECFEPTYEELKHMRPMPIAVKPYCFEPTYEELKQISKFL